MIIDRYIAKAYVLINKAFRRFKMCLIKPAFKSHGRNFVFDPNGVYSYNTIVVGDDVFIGPGANFSASESAIVIGNKVMFGPNVTIMGGDHNTSQIGKYMYDVKEKLAKNDQSVSIDDDVWIGCNVLILKGVTIGRGSIVGAGSVVTRSCPPYSIMLGSPAKVVKQRFSDLDLQLHEKLLKQNDI